MPAFLVAPQNIGGSVQNDGDGLRPEWVCRSFDAVSNRLVGKCDRAHRIGLCYVPFCDQDHTFELCDIGTRIATS